MGDKERILRELKDGGHRMTKARTAIVDFLLKNKLPITASGILAALQSVCGFKCDRVTIYRELNFLVEKGIVCRVNLVGKATHYEIEADHHHHLVCTKCNSIKEVFLANHLENHERSILKNEKFKVMSHSLEFYGLCKKCS